MKVLLGSGEPRVVRHDAIARVIRDCVHEAGFRTKWQPGNLPNLPGKFGIANWISRGVDRARVLGF
eukprot:6828260-Pyramimonas_sp.AAC.1